MKPLTGRARTFALLVVALVLGGWFFAAGLSGVAAADTSIEDSADVIDDSAVLSASEKIEDANVFVVTFADPPSRIDSAVEDLGAAAGFSTVQRKYSDNTITIAIYPGTGAGDGQVGIYYGADFFGSLDATYASIENAMVPQLRSGDFTGAVVAGLDAIQAQVHSNSGTIKWIIVAVIFGLAVMWVIYQRVKKSRAETAERKRKEKLVLDNQYLAMTMAGELEKTRILLPTLTDSPAEDVLAADVTSIEVALNRRFELESNQENSAAAAAAADPDADARRLAVIKADLESVDSRLAILRQETGWQDRWNSEISTARTAGERMLRNAQTLVGAKPDLKPDVELAGEPVDLALVTLANQVLAGALPIADGIQALGVINKELKAKEDVVDRQLKLMVAEQEEARQQADRQSEQQAKARWQSDNNRGSGGFWGGFLGGVAGSSSRRRSSSGRRSSSSGRSRSSGGRRGGGGSRSF